MPSVRSYPADNAREVALDYGARGWFIVPLVGLVGAQCRCRAKSNCGSPGKHPNAWLCPHGAKDASRHPATILRWFDRLPEITNLGIVTGPSSLVVIDVDPRNGGSESLAQMIEDGADLPDTLVSETGGGGLHFVYLDTDRGARPAKPFPGIDILAGRNLFVAPPSQHHSGGSYSWRDPMTPIAPAPRWLVEAGAR